MGATAQRAGRSVSRALSAAEVLALPAAVDLATAARALDLGRTSAYSMAKRGEFPVPLLRLGSQYRARRTDLLELLGIEQPATAPAA
jgi:predicted DNA-binding transcriptional regulator AlpA